MRDETRAILDRLDKLDWFYSVGQQEATTVEFIGSWQIAVMSAETIEWENVRIEAANIIRRNILQHSKERLNQWNVVAGGVRPMVQKLITNRVEPVALALQLPEKVTIGIRWNIAHWCMESEYADIYAPGFYSTLGTWYERGHFPCGWKGVFPKGHLVIY